MGTRTLAQEAPPIHPSGDAALKMRSYLSRRIEALRDELEHPGCGVLQADQMRGAIAECRRLHRILTPEPAIEGTASTY